MQEHERGRSGSIVAEVSARVESGLDRIFGGLSADSVFGAEQVEDRVVITAAAIERAGGFGFGAGQGSDDDGKESGGGGGGGGGTGQARPVAIIEVTPDGVSVRPVLDYTKIGVTVAVSAIAALRFLRRT